jgi:dihydroorotate dehydrogenase electron transfer subunit
MRDFRSIIRARTHHAAGLFTLRCEGPELARLVRPGRFAMVGIEGYIRPYLRRAFSFADSDPARGEVEFLVKTVGVGTRCLEELPAGSKLSILAPLGNAFTVEDLSAGDRVAIVAGGVGVAPFPLLLRELSERQVVADLYFGGRTCADLAYREKISHLVTGREFDSTDDGSFGHRGRVTESLAQEVRGGARYRRVFACGPTPMFRTLAGVVAELGLAAEFSTEAPMGCGFGACLACVLPKPGGGYIVSCQEGPILSPDRVAWEAC